VKTRLFAAVILSGLLAPSAAVATSVTSGAQGWGGSAFDFTQAQTVDGAEYFGWNPLTIDAGWSNGTFTFDITMPRELTGGDNFDLVIDWNNDRVDSDGDFIVHYANNGANNGWDGIWDAKSHVNGNWSHIESEGLGDLPITVDATKLNDRQFQISFDGDSDISYQWLSPLGDDGFPEGWTGGAVIIGFWDGDSADDNIPVPVSASAAANPSEVPEPATLALLGAGLTVIGLVARRRR
jgi:hypothetical protein